MPGKKRLLPAAGSGLLMTAAFPNIGLSFLAWFALLPLLLAVRQKNARDNFWIGFTAGLVHFLSLIYWIAYTMRTYGYLPVVLCVLVLLLLSAVLALYWAGFAVLAGSMPSRPLLALFTLPAFWAGLEYMRSFFLSGFPWEIVAYSQYRHLHIIQMADVTGSFGISYVVVLINVAAFLAIQHIRRKPWQGAPVSGPSAVMAIGAGILVLLSSIGYGIWRIPAIDRLSADRPIQRIAVIQGNIDQSRKWDPALQKATLEKYFNLTQTATRRPVDLVVWPETAAPFYYQYDEKMTQMLNEGVAAVDTTFLIGIPTVQIDEEKLAYYNTAILISPEGRALSRYHKAHLVPFGEYVPLRRFFPFLGKMVAQVGDFTPGQVGKTIRWGDHGLGPLICYELIFPYLARHQAANGADLLLNLTNDAWYGRTAAPYQHFSMAVFRSVENRRFMVRAANTGVSGFIDAAGRIMATTPLFEDAAISADVALLDHIGWYTRYGDWFGQICLAGAGAAAIWMFAGRRQT